MIRTDGFTSDVVQKKTSRKTLITNRNDKLSLPNISFGNGIFDKDFVPTKDLRIGITGALWQQPKTRQTSGDLLIGYVDELRTSKVENDELDLSYE